MSQACVTVPDAPVTGLKQSPLDAALHLAAASLRVAWAYGVVLDDAGEPVGCTCGRTCAKEKPCEKKSWGKHPFGGEWQKRASDEPAVLREQYAAIGFAPNIGLVMGVQSDGRYLVAVDEDDAERMALLVAAYGPLPPTMMGRSPRGKRSLYSIPEGAPRERLRNTTGLRLPTDKRSVPGVDVKAESGFVVVIGRNAGGEYADFDPSHSIAELPPSWLPPMLAPEDRTPTTKAPKSERKKRAETRDSSAWLPDDAAVAHVPVPTRRRRAVKWVEDAKTAVQGEQGSNEAMRVATALVRGFCLRRHVALAVMQSWSQRCSPPWSAQELEHKVDEAYRVGAMSWGKILLAARDGAKPRDERPRYTIVDAVDIAKPLPPVKWICPGLRLLRGGLLMVGGYGYSRKSMFAQEVACSVATGRRLLGVYSSEQGPALHFDFEQGAYITNDRYQRLAFAKGVSLAEAKLHTITFPRFRLTDPDARDALRTIFDRVKPTVVVVDSLRAACPGVEENDSRIREPMDMLGEALEGCGVLIHHAKKPQKGEAAGKYSLRGSSAIFDALDGAFVFSGEKGEPTTVTQEKDRFLGNELEAFGLTSEDVAAEANPRAGLRLVHLEGAQLAQLGATAAVARHDKETDRAISALRSAFRKARGPIAGSKDELRTTAGVGAAPFRRALAILQTTKAVEKRGTYHAPEWHWIGGQP